MQTALSGGLDLRVRSSEIDIRLPRLKCAVYMLVVQSGELWRGKHKLPGLHPDQYSAQSEGAIGVQTCVC